MDWGPWCGAGVQCCPAAGEEPLSNFSAWAGELGAAGTMGEAGGEGRLELVAIGRATSLCPDSQFESAGVPGVLSDEGFVSRGFETAERSTLDTAPERLWACPRLLANVGLGGGNLAGFGTAFSSFG